MIIKRSGSKIFGAHLTKNEHRALEIEMMMGIEQQDLQRMISLKCDRLAQYVVYELGKEQEK